MLIASHGPFVYVLLSIFATLASTGLQILVPKEECTYLGIEKQFIASARPFQAPLNTKETSYNRDDGIA